MTLPRQAVPAPVIDLYTRQPIMDTPTQHSRPHGPWFKSTKRLQDASFIALTPVAKAALCCLEELVERDGTDTITAPKKVLAGWIGFTLKWLNEAIAQLTDGGFIVTEDTKQGLSITLARTWHGSSKVKARPKQDPSMDQARPKHGTQELPIDAGSSDCPLIEKDKEKEIEKEKKTKAKKERFSITQTSEGFQRFAAEYPNATELREAWEVWQSVVADPDTEAAVFAGLVRWKGSRRWADGYIKAPHRWLRDGLYLETPQQAANPHLFDEIEATKAEFAALGF